MSDQIVAVTGAAGRIGERTLLALASAGYEVIAIDRHVGRGPGRWHVANLASAGEARDALRGASHVVHLAALTQPDPADPIGVLLTNLRLAGNVLEGFAGPHARAAVLASSMAVYGMAWSDRAVSPDSAPIDEEHPCNPDDTYSVSKLASEQLFAAYARLHGWTCTALRFPWAGAGEPDLLADRRRSYQAEPGSHESRRHLWSYVHPDDVADAAVRSLALQGGSFRALNIAAPGTLTNRRTSDLMATYHPTTALRSDIDSEGPWSTRRARDLLGWRATLIDTLL
jgi:nucleoside-diphosphate-sugar epimerase